MAERCSRQISSHAASAPGRWLIDHAKLREAAPTGPLRGYGDNRRAYVVDYRKVIHSLRTKPGALPGLAYREQLFQQQAYRRIFEVATEALPEKAACALVVGASAIGRKSGGIIVCRVDGVHGDLARRMHADAKSAFFHGPQKIITLVMA